MYSIVVLMALSSSSATPGFYPEGCYVSWGCCGGYYYFPVQGGCGAYLDGGLSGAVQPASTQPAVGGGEGPKPIATQKWPENVTRKVKNTLADKDIMAADADQLINDAQAFGCKGGDFTDFLSVPGVKTQKGNDLRNALQIYLGTLKNIAADPSPKKWPANVVTKVKATLKQKELAPDDADRFIEDAQEFGCKGADFDDFLSVPGLKTQKGDKLKDALEIYMKTLRNIRQNRAAQATPARIEVTLPADAELVVDDRPTTSTSSVRHFVTPPLEQGRAFHYTLTARFLREGQSVRATQEVSVRAGRTTRVKLEAPAGPGVASRR